jgi:hypothetical protein
MADLRNVEFAHKLREFHHDALWEEEKHFTWLATLLLSFQGLLFSSEKPFPGRLALLVIASLLGILLSIVALEVIRKEGQYFHHNLKHFVDEYNEAFPDRKLRPAPEKANKELWKLIRDFILTGRLGGREAFQIVFLGFIGAFSATIVSSVWRFWWLARHH